MEELPSAFSIYDTRASPLEMKCRVYSSCDRNSIVYGSETISCITSEMLLLFATTMSVVKSVTVPVVEVV